MKILQIIPGFYPATKDGGPIDSVFNLSKGLQKIGHEVDILTTNIDSTRNIYTHAHGWQDFKGLNVYYAKGSKTKYLYSPELKKFLKKEISKYDFVETNSMFLYPNSIASKIARKKNVPYVNTPRGSLSRELINAKSRIQKKISIFLFEKRNLRNADFIHITSRLEMEKILELFPDIKEKNFLLLPNPKEWDPNFYEELKTKERIYPFKYFLYLGRINWKKRIDLAIGSFQKFVENHKSTQMKLIIAGKDSENYLKYIFSKFDKNFLDKYVVYTGEVLGEEKWEILKNAESLLVPSISENFGNVVLESTLVGTPVISNKNVGSVEYFKGIDGIFITDYDPNNIAKCMEYSLSVSQISKDRLAHFAYENFNSEAIAKKYISILNSKNL